MRILCGGIYRHFPTFKRFYFAFAAAFTAALVCIFSGGIYRHFSQFYSFSVAVFTAALASCFSDTYVIGLYKYTSSAIIILKQTNKPNNFTIYWRASQWCLVTVSPNINRLYAYDNLYHNCCCSCRCILPVNESQKFPTYWVFPIEYSCVRWLKPGWNGMNYERNRFKHNFDFVFTCYTKGTPQILLKAAVSFHVITKA